MSETPLLLQPRRCGFLFGNGNLQIAVSASSMQQEAVQHSNHHHADYKIAHALQIKPGRKIMTKFRME
jgi:hypothetical protein